MNTIERILACTPALLNSGDETRGVTQIIPTLRFPKFKKVNSIYPGTIPIRVICLDRAMVIHVNPNEKCARSLDIISNWALAHSPFVGDKILSVSFNTSILQPNATFLDYNIHPNDTLNVNVYYQQGGCRIVDGKVLPTYEIIDECEAFVSSNLIHFSKLQNFEDMGDETWSFLEDIWMLLMTCSNARTASGIFGASVLFIKTQLKTSKPLLKDIFELIQGFLNDISSNILQVQSNDNVVFTWENFSWLWEKFTILKDSDIFKKIIKLLCLVITIPLLSVEGKKFNYKRFSDMYENGIAGMLGISNDFASFILDALKTIVKKGAQYYKYGTFESLLLNSDSCSEWHDNYSKIKMWSKLLNDPESHGFNIFTYETLLDETLAKGQNTIKYVLTENGSAKEKAIMRNLVNDLRLLKAELCTKRMAQKARKAPIGFLIQGTPGIGKSGLVHLLFTHYGKLFDLPIGSEYLYTRNAVDQFWSGFTSNQWAILLDDIGFLNPNAAPNGDPSLLEMLQVVNNVPFCPNQAELEMKGKTPLRAKLCLATANTEHLNAHAYFAVPFAARRRLPYVIQPHLKPHYETDGRLDASKLPLLNEGEYPDFWTFKIKKVVPVGDMAETVVVHEFDNIYDLIVWFSKVCKKHECDQSSALTTNQKVESVTICKDCYRPSIKCTCNMEVQSLDTLVSYAGKAIFFSIVQWIKATIRVMFWSFICSLLYWKRPEMNKEYFTYSMRHIFDKNNNKLLIGLGALFGTAAVSYATYATFKKMSRDFNLDFDKQDLQGNLAPVTAKQPTPKEQERNNEWIHVEREITHLDFGNQTISMGDNRDTIQKWITNNTVCLEIFYEREGVRRKCTQNAVCLHGQYYVANNHGVPSAEVAEIHIIQSARGEPINMNTKIVCDTTKFTRFPEKDLVFFHLRCLPPKKDIRGLMVKSSITTKNNGFMITRNSSGVREIRELKALYAEKMSLGHLGVKLGYRAFTSAATQNGDCGSPWIIQTGYGFSLVGLHVAGMNNIVGAIPLTLDDIPNSDLEVQSGAPMLSAPSAQRELGALHPKNVFNWIDNGTCALYGSFVGFRPNKKSNVSKTFIYDSAIKHGFKDECDKPLMNGYVPWRLAALEMVNPANDFNTTLLKEASTMYYKEISSLLSNNTMKEIHPYDLDTVVNGAPGVAFVDKMNRKTSTGCPWKTTKKRFLRSHEDETKPDWVEFDDEILDRVHIMLDNYKAGKRNHPVFCGNLKDEALPKEKCELGKTRVFAGAPVDWSICVRMYYLPLIRAMQNNQEVFECAVGVAAQSSEWTRMYDYITRFGEHRIFAGDYKKYDKRMPATVIQEAFDVLINLARDSGNYSREDLLVMKGIAMDTAFPMMDFNGTLVEFFGSNPSGHPLTVIINCIVNSIYMRYCFIEAAKDASLYCKIAATKPLFKNYVSLMTYGDDNIASVSQEINWFNHTSIQDQLAKVGVTYTMADKISESVPFIHIRDCNFLKRTWRWEQDLNAYACPLEEASIHKMLTRGVISKDISSEAHSCAVLDTALREYFWHGRSIFEEKRKIFQIIVEENQLGIYTWEGFLPTWDQLVEAFKSKTYVPPWSLSIDHE